MNKILFILSLSFTTNLFSADMVGSDLISYFSSTCKTQGEYTRQAVSDAQSLITILENVKNDADCSTISGGISQLSNLELQLSQLESQKSLNVEIEKLTAQENELMIQLSQTTDASVQYNINSTIRQIQINKASYVSELSARNEYQGYDVKDVYSRIVNSTNSVFNSIASNHRCLNKNPNILPAITSLAGAIGSAAIEVNPALGLGIAAATDFIGHTVESLRKGKYNSMIRKISDSGIALEGYKCVLESLSSRWCSLEDAQNFLDLKSSIRRQNNEQSGLKSAIRLHDRDIPVLLDWLSKVRTGVPATTTADAERQAEVFNREAIVRSAKALGNGIISQNRPLYDSRINANSKYNVVKSVVASLTGTNCSGSGMMYESSTSTSNPLSDIYGITLAPYYLLGLSDIPTNNGYPILFCNFNPFSQWPGGTYTPDLNQVQLRYNQWIEDARELVNEELTLVLQPDALQVLTTAYEQTGNQWKFSTIKAIDNLKDFIEKFKPKEFQSSSFRKIYESTAKQLVDLKVVIEGAVHGDKYIAPKVALEDIFRIAQLQYGVIVFKSRLEMIVRVSIKEYLDSLNNSYSNSAAQLLAAESFLDVLSKVSGTDNLALISADIKRAKPIAIGNMTSFVDVFGKNINRILKNNYKNIQRSDDPTLNEVYTRNAAEICLLLSSMPTWPKKVNKKYCLNSKLDEVISGGPSSSPLTKAYLKQHFNKRNCGYRNYIRKSKIYQEWGLKL